MSRHPARFWLLLSAPLFFQKLLDGLRRAVAALSATHSRVLGCRLRAPRAAASALRQPRCFPRGAAAGSPDLKPGPPRVFKFEVWPRPVRGRTPPTVLGVPGVALEQT